MPVIDPSGVQVSVEVITRGGTIYRLWVGGAISGEGPDAESIFNNADTEYQDLPIVTAVNIEMSMNYNATLTVEIGAPYDLGLELLNSELFTIGNSIAAQIGYPRIGMFLPRIATMAVKPSVSINPDDGLTATLNGQGGVFAALRGQTTRTVENISVRDMIQQVADLPHNRWVVRFPEQQRVGLENFEDFVAATLAGNPTDPNDLLYSTRVSISQRNENDWAFVTRLCRQVGCRMTVRPVADEGGRTQLIIQRESDVAREDPVFTITSRGQIDMIAPNGRFPLLSFESENDGMFLEPGSDRVTASDVDPRTGDTVTREADQESVADDEPPAVPQSVGTGSRDGEEVNVSGTPDPADGGDGRVSAPITDTERSPAEAVRQETREQGARGRGINATVSTIGVPMAFPGDRLTLENIGLFSGNYEIIGMSHVAGEGEWTTSMRLLRRGGFDPLFIDEALRRPQDWNPSNQPVPDQPDIGEDATSGGTTTIDPESLEGI